MNGTQGFQGCPGHRGTKVHVEGACMEQAHNPAGGSPLRATSAALGCHVTAAKSTWVVMSTWPSTKVFCRCHGFNIAMKSKRAAQ